MEATIMFAVGVLTMVLLAVASLAVYSTVMVLKLKNKIENLTRYTQEESSNIYRNIIEREDRTRRDLNEVTDHLDRTIEDIHQHFTKKINEDADHVHRTIDNVNRDTDQLANELIRRIDELNSYVDRRFDKLIDTYLLVKETEQESKKIIKG